MKVDKPSFRYGRRNSELRCNQCPLEGEDAMCAAWLKGHGWMCPTAATYAEACRLAEEANGV